MTRHFVFNGDADGLCALQQLRLADSEKHADAAFVTGVKRDIALLERVQGQPGDSCTVLDISLDVNRTGLRSLLEAGVAIRYFDHHFAGEVPTHPRLQVFIDLAPGVCTSILVDRYLHGRFRRWAAVGAFGDSLVDEGRALSRAAGVADERIAPLQALGVAINYNAYGETVADLHVPPAELADEMLAFPDPLAFLETSQTFDRLREGFREDMARASRIEPARRVAGAITFLLPDLPWARRASGTLANDLVKANAGSAVAIVSPKSGGGYLVSVRVPSDGPTSAESFCRRFPTGGGRRTAAGINDLPGAELDNFIGSFEREFGRA